MKMTIDDITSGDTGSSRRWRRVIRLAQEKALRSGRVGMGYLYDGDTSRHEACPQCEFCKTCGDCEKYGCGDR